MVKKLLEKLLKKAYPDRNMSVERLGRRMFIVTHDTLGTASLKLSGTYSYNEVVKLNEITTHSAKYGYCPQIGPVAIIGIPNPNYDFIYFNDVYEYGKVYPENDKYQFEKYSEEDAKNISNYTVFVNSGSELVECDLKFEKISAILDERHKITESHKYRVIEMKCQLEGKHSFKEIEKLIQHDDFRMMDRGVAYATLDSGQHIAIVSFWYDRKDEVAGFKDVWEYGKEEPEIQDINFMTKEEAEKFDDYLLYLYDYKLPHNLHGIIKIKKMDRTFDERFDFLDNSEHKDFRLIPQTYLYR